MANPSQFERSVWVSYSGKQQDVITTLMKMLESKEYKKSGYYQAKQSQIKNLYPFKLHTYQRRLDAKGKDNDKQPYYQKSHDSTTTTPSGNGAQDSYYYWLNVGDKVSDLVGCIALNLRRLVLLSPDYLKSEHCLWELAECLRDNVEEKPLFLVLLGFEKNSDWSAEQNYSIGGESLNISLACALATVERAKNPACINDADCADLENRKAFFEKQLESINEPIRLRFDTEASIDYKKFATELHLFVESIKVEKEIQDQHNYITTQFNDWSTETYARSCLEKYKAKKNKAFSAKHLLNVDMGSIETLCKCLIEDTDRFDDDQKRARRLLKQFAGLLALLMVEPAWAGEMRRFSLGGQVMRFSVGSAEEGTVRKEFELHLALSAVYKVALEFTKPSEELFGYPDYKNKVISLHTPAFECLKQTDASVNDTLLTHIVVELLGIDPSATNSFNNTETQRAMLYQRLKASIRESDGMFLGKAFLLDSDQDKAFSAMQIRNAVSNINEQLNKNARQGEEIYLGLLTLANKNEGNICQLVCFEELITQIEYLLQRAHDNE